MRVDAFGRELEILRRGDDWVVFDSGSEGKKRLAHDIVIPGALPESDIIEYLSDLLHEYATLHCIEVKLLD